MAKRLLIDSDVTRRLYQGRGVPPYVLWGDYPRALQQVVQRVEVQRDEGVKTYTVAKQIQAFEATIAEPLSAGYTFAVGADNNDKLSTQIALKIFHAATIATGMKANKKPYWHVLDGSTKDRLRDDQTFQEIHIGRINLLVISNIASNSTAMKVEKLRDLLVKYSDIPRVVVINGADPFKYFEEVLYMRPTRVMYFGRRGG